MKKALLFALVTILLLSACSSNRQKLSPQANLYLKSANVYYSQKDNDDLLKKALGLYEKVLADNPNHVIALKRSADLNYFFALRIEPKKDDKTGTISGLENASEAIRLFKITYGKYDSVVTVMNTFEKLNDEERSIKRDAARKKESSWVKIFRISQMQIEKAQYPEAKTNLETLISLDPNRQEPLRSMVILAQASQDTTSFELYLTKVLAQSPDDKDMLRMLGVHYYNKQEYAKAITYFEKIMNMDLTDLDNLTNLTNAYYELGDYNAANAVNQRILRIEPDNLGALITAKDIARKLGNQDDEILYMQKIVAKTPTPENLRAYCYMMLNYQKYDGLMEYAERWYELEPTNSEAIQMCWTVATRTNRKDLAQKYIDIYNALPKD
jgi:tetratricopeptide (TPR) repeat protein